MKIHECLSNNYYRNNALYLGISEYSVINFSPKESIELFTLKLNNILLSSSMKFEILVLPSSVIYPFRPISIMLLAQLSIHLNLSIVSTFFTNIHTLRYLYICLVRFRLEYCSITRSPYHDYLCEQIKSIQHRF